MVSVFVLFVSVLIRLQHVTKNNKFFNVNLKDNICCTLTLNEKVTRQATCDLRVIVFPALLQDDG